MIQTFFVCECSLTVGPGLTGGPGLIWSNSRKAFQLITTSINYNYNEGI